VRKLLQVGVWLLLSAAGLLAEDMKLPADWPPSWAEAYRRYEKFLVDKQTYFPAADFEIGESGQLISHIPWVESLREHLNFDFYKDGVRQMPMPGVDQGVDTSNLPPGAKYPVVAISCGLVNYQYLYPFVWIETRDLKGGGGRREVRMVSPPEDPEAYWPNERLFSYRDFTTFPNNYRDDLQRVNNKVTPWIKLEVANDGTIHRERLDPKLERHLRWRIYHNERLIEKGPAKPSPTHPSPRKAGEYHVFLGIEGPGGFMPVSNELNFPLFPDGRGGVCVYPETRKMPGVPDFVLDVMTDEEKERLAREVAEGDPMAKEYVASEVIYELQPRRPEDAALVNHWTDWLWHLNHPRGEDVRLRFRMEPSSQ